MSNVRNRNIKPTPGGVNSFGQFEKLIDSIIDAKVQEAIQAHGSRSDKSYVDDRVQEEALSEDFVRDMINDEIEAIDWCDRVIDELLMASFTEDTLESTRMTNIGMGVNMLRQE